MNILTHTPNRVLSFAVLYQKSVAEKAAKPSPKREMSFGTAEAKARMEGVVLPDEWLDDEFSQQKLAGVDSAREEDSFFRRRVPPKVRQLIHSSISFGRSPFFNSNP